MEEEEAIRNDKKSNPQCHYSTSTSKSCTLANGKFVCDTMRRVDRLCPDQPPHNIFARNSNNKNNNNGQGTPSTDDGDDLIKSFFGSMFQGSKFPGFPSPDDFIGSPQPPPERFNNKLRVKLGDDKDTSPSSSSSSSDSLDISSDPIFNDKDIDDMFSQINSARKHTNSGNKDTGDQRVRIAGPVEKI